VNVPADESGVKAVLLDIEGTTTPIEFVYQVLFPYARQQVTDFLLRHQDATDAQDNIEALRKERVLDLAQGLEPPEWRADSVEAVLNSAAAYFHWLMDRDRKSTGLKSLQGKIWEQGYRTGKLRGEVYADVSPAFSRWQEQKKQVCIFSSGSVLAQKLLFAHTTAGDLTKFINEYFDTTTGPKTEPESYCRIAVALGLLPQDILFVSDVPAELDAAKVTNIKTLLCVRPGRERPPTATHPIIDTFDGIFP
jgi:enolase-phosphatase E1